MLPLQSRQYRQWGRELRLHVEAYIALAPATALAPRNLYAVASIAGAIAAAAAGALTAEPGDMPRHARLG